MRFSTFLFILVFQSHLIFTQIPAFPGAEGFGSTTTTGGRGGNVYYVSNLNCSGPGSLNDALNKPGPKYILFSVSGVIDCAAEIEWGDCYIAGQTSPGGIIVRGILIDDFYEPSGKAQNIIIRHLNSRPGNPELRPGKGWVLDDALRIDGAKDVVIDHCSFENALDECIQLSRSSRVTISNSMLAETLGGHFDLGGMLINYSTAAHPKDSISLHHNLWNRIGGRMPEISCEESGEKPGDRTCLTRPFRFEFSNNLLWDPNIQIYYGPGFSPANTTSFHDIYANFVSNHAISRPGYCGGFFNFDLLANKNNQFYTAGNSMARYPNYTDYQLFYCCNDFCQYNPNTENGSATRKSTRFPYPSISYTPANQLRNYMVEQVGAFNGISQGRRDPMNKRLLNALRNNVIDTKPVDGVDYYKDAYTLDFLTQPASPKDTDVDGMPDAWEIKYGLDTNKPDHNGTQLSNQITGVSGYTNLECYLNELSKQMISGTATPVNEIKEQKPQITYLGEGRFKVVFSNLEGEKFIATLSDLTGRLLLQFPVENGIGEGFKKGLPKGLYLLSLSNNKYRFSEKLFID
jgi:hypothetical protein